MNELVSIDGTTLAYDDNGNLVDDGTNTYEYDYENRLLKVTRKSDSAVLGQYKYDALGRRVEKSVGGNVTEYVYHAGQVIQEYTDGALGKEYVSGSVPSNGIVFTGSTAHAYHADSIGNVIGITDGSGNLVERYIYAPYGNATVFDSGGMELPGSSIDNEFMFALMRYDNESGLYHTLYRKYSVEQGRFTTHDPMRSLNPYVYAASNPINLVDPLGLWVQVPGETDVWMVEDGDTLWSLATQVSGQGLDWVCIWPKEMRNSGGYPNIIRKCDKFDVSNLTATSGSGLRLAVSPDLAANHNAIYGTTSESVGNVSTRIRDASNQGGTPISLFYLAGHGGTGGWSLSSLTSMSEATASPTYARAQAKKGPLRCWFTRNAEARFIGCSSDGFAASFAASVLRSGAFAVGTNQTIGHSSTEVY
jgi:RHS repeat-associated protein